jgi:hypothetical protein
MGLSKKERAIREKRTIEATKKNLMGPTGKLGMIATFLGHKIMRQGSGLFGESFLEDPYHIPDEHGLSMAEDSEVQEIGHVFDGLSRGMHLEIKHYDCDNHLIVDYKGYRVYEEIAGDLRGYAPILEWESLVDKLFKQAKERRDKLELKMAPFIEQMVLKKRDSWFAKMRKKWGL